MMVLAKKIVPALVLGLALIAAPAAFAHSLEDVELMLGAKQQYFQPMDKEGPGCTRRHAEGKTRRPTDFTDKVVFPHFIHSRDRTSCGQGEQVSVRVKHNG